MPASPRPATRAPLTRQRVLAAALALIDERGLDELTMRALGAELGVEAMSIYKHVPGKAAVLDGVVELLLAELGAGAVPGADWREQLTGFARQLRDLSLAHPSAFSLLTRRSVGAYLAGRSAVEAGVRDMMAGGFTRTDAINVIRLVVRFALGYSLTTPPVPGASWESDVSSQSEIDLPSEFPMVAGVITAMRRDGGEEDLFEFGLAVLLRGLEPLAATPRGDAGRPPAGDDAAGS